MDNPTITYDEMKAALEKDACGRETEPALFALLDKLNPTPPLFGRWAEHPYHGRGIIADVEPSADGDVEFAFPDDEDYETRTSSIQITLDEIDLDPVTLNGEQEFGKAPVGTIVENIKTPQDVYVKSGAVWYITGDTLGTLSEGMPACRVIRWGNGQ